MAFPPGEAEETTPIAALSQRQFVLQCCRHRVSTTTACWRGRPLPGNFRDDRERPQLGRYEKLSITGHYGKILFMESASVRARAATWKARSGSALELYIKNHIGVRKCSSESGGR
jgi:hypothetical protein